MRIFEELNRPVTNILDNVKETIVTENTYKAIPYNVLKTYFFLRECSETKKAVSDSQSHLPLSVLDLE